MTDGLKDAHREAIIAAIAANDRVERAVLFGSRATGTNTVSSDVDIALFGARLTLTDQARLAAALDEIPMAQSVDLLLYDSIRDRTLRDHVRDQGVEWYSRSCRQGGPGAPSEWPVMSLREAGVSLIDCEHRTPPASEDGYPYVGIPQLKDGRIDLAGARRIAQGHFREWTKKANPQPLDVVLSRRCNPGDTGFVSTRSFEFALGQNLVLLRADGKSILKPFLRWLVRSPAWWNQINKYLNVGAVFDSLKCGDIPDFLLPIPPLDDQRAIAHILGMLDDKIELNRRMNATQEAMARALFRSWFVDFDPVRAKMEGRDTGLPKEIADLFPDRLVDSELGALPTGWRVGQVEDGFEIVMGQSPPGHTYNDTGDGLPFFQGRSDFGFRYPKNRKFCTAPNRIAQPWDTIVSVRAPVGDINMAWERCCIGRGVAALRSRSGAVSHGYCAAQALQMHMREYEHTGTVFGAINRKQLARLPLSQPAPDVVQGFEDIVHPLDQMIRLRTAQVATLTALRDTLLPKLVSGELRANGLEPPSGRDDHPAPVGVHGA